MSKIIIYSVLPRLWANVGQTPVSNGTIEQNGCGKLSSWDESALRYVRSLGCTHIWFVGLLEHATTTAWEGIPADPIQIVKGRAGSPYAVRDYYDIAPSLVEYPEERMAEFEALIARTHRAGLKVLMDFIPNHVARTYHSDSKPPHIADLGEGDDPEQAFSTANCFYYFPDQALSLPVEGDYHEYPARATGNDCFTPTPSHGDWYETIKLNYGVDYLGGSGLHTTPIPVVWERMLEILRYWVDKGVDGFRCDMAEMVPEAFWTWAIPQLRAGGRELTFLAEIYQPHRYATYIMAGFDYLYDKVGVYDTTRAIMRGECSASSFDMARDAVGALQPSMCYFLENHDEQRIASDFFVGNARAGLPGLVASALSGSNSFLLYFGQELGESGMDAEGFSGRDGRTTIFDYWRISSLNRLAVDYHGTQLTPDEAQLLDAHRHILGLCHSEACLHSGEYHGLNYLQTTGYDSHRTLSFVRYYRGEAIIIAINFAHEARTISLRLTADLLKQINMMPNVALERTDLISQVRTIATLSHYAPLVLDLPALGFAILRYRAVQSVGGEEL